MKLPINYNWQQINSTDLAGSISASKNIDLRKRGYVKLSDRMVAIKSDNGDSNFDRVLRIQALSDTWKLFTSDQVYTLDNSQLTVTEDTSTNNPDLSIYSDGIYWNGAYYATGSSSFSTMTTGGAWSAITLSPALTASVNHAMCAFENRNTLAICNGSGVKQINTSHADTVNLVIPSDYKATKVAYCNNRVGVTTRVVTTTGNLRKEAMFYLWDGNSASANTSCGLNSIVGLDVIGYKSSFIVLNGKGQLLYFNSSGFDLLDAFPVFYSESELTDANNNPSTYGKMLSIEGNKVIINLLSHVQGRDSRDTKILPNMPTGVWVYDFDNPGLYHRNSPSTSLAIARTATADATTDIISVSATVPATGTPVRYFEASNLIGGLSIKKTYYTIKLSDTTFKVASSRTNALAGTAIDLTSAGSAFQYFIFYPENDFGQSYSELSATVESFPQDYYGQHSGVMASARLYGSALTQNYYLCVSVPDIENRGWFKTPKMRASTVTDLFPYLALSFKPLVRDIDEIRIKYRTTHYEAVTQPNFGNTLYCTWTSDTAFTTTDDYSTVQAGYEVEILCGAGAGQIGHISTITESGGTYTVTLTEAMRNISVGNKSQVTVDNWIYAGNITSSSANNADGYAEIPLGATGAWVQAKIELRGVGVTVEQAIIMNKPYKQFN